MNNVFTTAAFVLAVAIFAAAPGRAEAPARTTRIPFDGLHQAGVTTPGHGEATFAALDCIAPSRGALSQALEALSSRARALTPVSLPAA